MVKDRPRGILSPADRNYLENPDDRSAPAQYKRREAIVERAQNAIYDLALIKSQLPQNLREDVFDDGRVYNDFSSALAFLFLGLTDENSSQSDAEMLEYFIESAVRLMYTERGLMVTDASVTIDVDTTGELPTYDELDSLTLSEAVRQLESGELTPEVLVQYLRDEHDDEFEELDAELSENGMGLEIDLSQFKTLREEGDEE